MPKKILVLRRPDACGSCATEVAAGARAEWDSDVRAVTCLDCVDARPASPGAAVPAGDDAVIEQPDVPESGPLDTGIAGASARKEFERRQAKRERALEEKWGTGRIGRIAKVLSDDPQSTRAWKEGAAGEERVAQILQDRLGDRAVLLHDRRVPGTKGNIDHIAIAASGVWIIDAKRYKGKVEKRDKGGWFSTDLRLYVGGRDRTKLVEKMGWQRDAAVAAIEEPDVPVHCSLTFVGAEWPLFFAKPLRLGDVWVSWPGKLADLIAGPGSIESEDVQRIAHRLSERLPAVRV